MWVLRTIAAVGLFVCAAAWAQSAAAPAAQATPSSIVAAVAGQDNPLPKAPEYKLEPVAVPNVAYPPQARDEKIEGEVVVSMRISGAGDVIIVGGLKGDPLLAHAVEEAVKRWKFKPVIKWKQGDSSHRKRFTQIRSQ